MSLCVWYRSHRDATAMYGMVYSSVAVMLYVLLYCFVCPIAFAAFRLERLQIEVRIIVLHLRSRALLLIVNNITYYLVCISVLFVARRAMVLIVSAMSC